MRYYLLFFLIIFESCLFFGPSTFKSADNFLVTDSMMVVNARRKQKIISLKIYTDTVDTFTGRNLILDTSFKEPVDAYKIPFSKDSLNKNYVHIFIQLTSPPDLSLSTNPGDLMKKRKILFEGDRY